MTGGNLAVNAAVNLDLGDLFLASTGNVTQTALIQSNGLGLMVSGSTTLQDPTNDVNVIAADNGGVTLFTDADDLTVGSVMVDGMLVTGITTVDADAKLANGGNLAVNAAVNLGLGNLFLASTGNVTQTALIQSDGLGLMVSGLTTLQDPANDVNVIAADNGGVTLFTDADDLTVGSVMVDGMLVTGITTVDADAKLVTGGDLAVNAAVNLGSGDLFLAVAGNVTQTAAVNAAGLGLMVSGSTILQNPANDVDVIAANNVGVTLFTDVDDLTVGSVLVDGMTVTGIITSNADVKLSADGDLTIEKAISIGGGSLFLDVGGNVTQVESIAANALALMVDGITALQNATNDVNQLAAANSGTVWFTDANDFNVSSVTVDGMTVKGIEISGNFVVIANGNISQAWMRQ